MRLQPWLGSHLLTTHPLIWSDRLPASGAEPAEPQRLSSVEGSRWSIQECRVPVSNARDRIGTSGTVQGWTCVMQALQVRRRGSRGLARWRTNPDVPNVEPEILTSSGRRWVERAQRPLDVLAVVFLIDVILIWSSRTDRRHS
jgi:hypothetical protein